MHSNLLDFLNRIRSDDISDIYPLLFSDSFSSAENEIAEKLKVICTSHFFRERQNKLNSLIRLRELGFSPQIVIDVGAQIGTQELYQSFPNAHHIFIEPVAECLPALNEIANNLSQCTIYNCAVSNIEGKTKISLSESRQYSSIEVLVGEETRIIDLRTVDSIFLDNGSPDSVLLKIDVDGVEVKVLQGSTSLFNKECVIIIESTLGDRDPRFNKIVEYLSDFGYKVFDIIDPLYRMRDWHLWQVDLVFIHEDSRFWNDFTF